MPILEVLHGRSRAQLDAVSELTSHLQRLLGTPRGFAPMDPQYGIADFSGYADQRGRQVLIEDVKRLIERYEPRLHDVRVTPSPTEGGALLCLDIQAVVAGGEPLQFRTEFMSGGQIRVSV